MATSTRSFKLLRRLLQLLEVEPKVRQLMEPYDKIPTNSLPRCSREIESTPLQTLYGHLVFHGKEDLFAIELTGASHD